MSSHYETAFSRGSTNRRSLNSYPRGQSVLSGGKSTDALRPPDHHSHSHGAASGQADMKGAVGLYPARPTHTRKTNTQEQVPPADLHNIWNLPQDVQYKQQMRLGFMDWRNSYSEKARPRYNPHRTFGYTPPSSQPHPREVHRSVKPPANHTSQNQQHRDVKSYITPAKGHAQEDSSVNLYRSNSGLDLDKSSHNYPLHDMRTHREFGSTTSLDIMSDNVQTDEGLFTILKAYKSPDKEQRAPAPTEFQDILQVTPQPAKTSQYSQASRPKSVAVGSEASRGLDSTDDSGTRPQVRSRQSKSKETRSRPKSSAAESSSGFIRKILGKHESSGSDRSIHLSTETEEARQRQKHFIHYDTQSIGIDFSAFAQKRLDPNAQERRNMATGASAASANKAFVNAAGEDLGDSKSNSLLYSCPYFRNELGGEEEWCITLNRHTAQKRYHQLFGASIPATTVRQPMCNGVSVLDQSLSPMGRWVPAVLVTSGGLVIEYVDHGAQYYREFFHHREHQNYFGIDENLGPVAISFKREFVRAEGSHVRNFRKEEEPNGQSGWHQYRLIIRCSELPTLRGCVLEEAIPTVRQVTATRGLPAKEVLEFVAHEMSWQCLRLSLAEGDGDKAVEQLIKLDEQRLTKQYKVGIMYCRAGQLSEEDMYSNEFGSPELEEFLDCVGTKVRLKGFDKYKGGLDHRSDSTGIHSYHTQFLEYEIMFHVSTMLPFSPTNKQQLLRKRHIGNDIVTIVFQELGCQPFSPKAVRSQFQHVFIVVRAHKSSSGKTKYSIAVSRSKDVPVFGPPLPDQAVFSKGEEFKHFLLTKVINAENAVHFSDKFISMATRTREEYLKDLATNFVSSTPIETGSRLSLFLSSKKKKDRSQDLPEACARGAKVWSVQVTDFGRDERLECFLGISMSMLVLVEEKSREVVFTCPCKSVIGWTCNGNSLRLFYDRGEYISMHMVYVDDLQEITRRLEAVTHGAQTEEFRLSRNSNNQLGLHVQHEGVVSIVEPASPAQRAGIKQGSRIVAVCDEVVASLTHQQMVDLLRSSAEVKVVVIPPSREGNVRKGVDEMKASHRAFLTTYTTPLSEIQETPATYPSSASRSGSYLIPDTSARNQDIHGPANYVDFGHVGNSHPKSNKQIPGVKHVYQNSYDSTGSKSSGHGSDAPLSVELRSEPRTDTMSSEGFVSGGESLDRRMRKQPGSLQLPGAQPPIPSYSDTHTILSPQILTAPLPAWQQHPSQMSPPSSHASHTPELSPHSLGYSNLTPRPYSRPKEYSPTTPTPTELRGWATDEHHLGGEMVEFTREPKKISPATVARHLSREDVRKGGGARGVYTDHQQVSWFDHSPHGSDSSKASKGRGRAAAAGEKGNTRRTGSSGRAAQKSTVDENLKRLINLDLSFNEDRMEEQRSPASTISYGLHRPPPHARNLLYSSKRTKSEESLVSPSMVRRYPAHYGSLVSKRQDESLTRSDVLHTVKPIYTQPREMPNQEMYSTMSSQAFSPDDPVTYEDLMHQLQRERQEKEELRRELDLIREKSVQADVNRLNNFY